MFFLPLRPLPGGTFPEKEVIPFRRCALLEPPMYPIVASSCRSTTPDAPACPQTQCIEPPRHRQPHAPP